MTSHCVAIIADAHFHDIEGDFGGAGLTIAGQRLSLRSWTDTRSGARAFNESAAALRAAIAQIARAGIRHVILAGDYTDDGQAENTRRLARLLADWQATHGLRFYAIPGNHDAFGPAGKHVSTRFATGPDTTVLVTSDPDAAQDGDPDAIVTPAMRCAGLPEALLPMARFGLFRQPADLHWESPFGPSDAPDARMYDAVSADGSITHRLMDASYLVEPEPGLWLLMLDATVFEPRPGRADPARKKAFLDPATSAWNAVVRAKPYLLSWIGAVAARAAASGKTLIPVSHYPILDPFRDSAGSETALFGATQVVQRTPSPGTADALAATGLRWHIGGHMHVSAISHTLTAAGPFTDVALPSPTAFPPGFGIVVASCDRVQVETVSLQDVPSDPRIEDSYRFQGRADDPTDHRERLAERFRRHVTDHVAPRDWPPALWRWSKAASCAQLCALLNGDPADLERQVGFAPGALSSHAITRLVVDAYLIRAGGPLARDAVDPDGLRVCDLFARTFGDPSAVPARSDAAFFRRFLSVLRVSLDRMAEPATVTFHPTPSPQAGPAVSQPGNPGDADAPRRDHPRHD